MSTYRECLWASQQLLDEHHHPSREVRIGAFLLTLLSLDDWSVDAIITFMGHKDGRRNRAIIQGLLQSATNGGIIVGDRLALGDWVHTDDKADGLMVAVSFCLDILAVDGQIERVEQDT